MGPPGKHGNLGATDCLSGVFIEINGHGAHTVAESVWAGGEDHRENPIFIVIKVHRVAQFAGVKSPGGLILLEAAEDDATEAQGAGVSVDGGHHPAAEAHPLEGANDLQFVAVEDVVVVGLRVRPLQPVAPWSRLEGVGEDGGKGHHRGEIISDADG